jgi:hypothetical protein
MIGTILKADTVWDDLAKIRFNWSSGISGDEFFSNVYVDRQMDGRQVMTTTYMTIWVN